MAGYKGTGNPLVHERPILTLPGPDANFGGVDRIWPFSSTNVWVQGPNETPSMYEQFQQVTQHFDGSKWASYLPTTIQYGEIVSSSITNTWALGSAEVGPHGHAIEMAYLDHFDGHAWKNITSGDISYSEIGPMAVSGNDFWYVTSSYNQVSIHHYSPLAGWNDMTTAGLPTTNNFGGLVVISPIDMWVATDDNRIFQYNGLSWHETHIQPLSSFAGLSVLSAKDAWISGSSTTGEAMVEHWNGKIWQVVPLAAYVPPNFDRNHGSDDALEIFALSPTDVWTLIIPAHASGGSFEHWDGSKWKLYTTPQYLLQYQNDIAPLPKEHALGVVTGNSTSQELVALTP